MAVGGICRADLRSGLGLRRGGRGLWQWAGCAESKPGPATSHCVEVGREGHSGAQQLQAQVGKLRPPDPSDAALVGLPRLTYDFSL